ncbi:hypothetical protein TIFTF001_011339 [Ficus carica]|uniref:Expansin n=1 Tax=Ficus carica TaxID=3494 RepID=A0AA87ZTL7_FICCA|nr:hypothetical protein TIFTF001_011339 [Ficus carica]
MARFYIFIALAGFMTLWVQATGREVTIDRAKNDWQTAHATFYGDMTGSETMPLFDQGLACGACFELMCVDDPQWCIPKAGTITVTATNFCPPNYQKPEGNWCNPPQQHFDLSMPMFTNLANYKAGIIPVQYRRVPCQKQGGVKFELKGNPYWLLVLVYNVGGAGDVSSVKIQSANTSWLQMSRNWGQNWQISEKLVGKSLSFQVMTSDGKVIQFDNVVPGNWQFGQTYDGGLNF